MYKLISIDLFADFGMLKKPDTNEPIYLTFNMLHKPALLGILGAIVGEGGFKEKGVLPNYYLKLQDLKIGIQPLNHENGNYNKTIITYNNTTGMASKEQGGNLMITEQTLVAPAYRCFFMLDTEIEIHQKADKYLSNYNADFLPYLGKNEFSVWWENYIVHDGYEKFDPQTSFKINSIFIKDQPIKDTTDSADLMNYDPVLLIDSEGNTYSYFERLPIGYTDLSKKTYQYEYNNFAYTDWSLTLKNKNSNLLLKTRQNGIIQVF